MNADRLITQERYIGIFRGFSEGGLEFHADLVLPYRAEYAEQPMHGQFLLVRLTDDDEVVLGRITALRSEGRLVDPEGEDYLIRQVIGNHEIPEDLRDKYLKFRVNIRVLGVLRQIQGQLTFVPSHRRLPNVGSPVALPSPRVLRAIAGHSASPDAGAALGFLAMGEFVWARQPDDRVHPDLQPAQDWMRLQAPDVLVRFPVKNLVARRTFIFAQSGFGKSNLVKLLFSELYRATPTIEKRGGRTEPVGTLIFDRDGEYFWPDDKGRPGLCDVPHLQEHLVVFTDRAAPSDFYGSFVVSGVKLDIRRLPASMVVGAALPPERQDQQNVRKLKGLDSQNWQLLVDLIYREHLNAPLREVNRLLGLEQDGEGTALVEANAARSNMYQIVKMLHDPNSRTLDYLVQSLRAGKLCVMDLSRMGGETARIMAGIILEHLFKCNQEEFVKRDAQTIPMIAVLEEAQSVLGRGENTAYAPFVSWVKEGRKYDLGAVMITQQPGSIPAELLSQGDVWFVFHLLSEGDLKAVQRANAHFSDDLLSALLNEPIPGHCVFWSSAGGKPYPLPIRILSFEARYTVQDPNYNRSAEPTYALQQRQAFIPLTVSEEPSEAEPVPHNDYLNELQRRVFESLSRDEELRQKVIGGEGISWGYLKRKIFRCLDETDPLLADADRLAFRWVKPALEYLFGREHDAWQTRPENGTTTVFLKDETRQRFLSHHGQQV
ncbi:MAG: DUF87 domain-containing protein [Fimbriimonadales bacterium]|nr:MAG: hypothetical protein KatS3mg018_1934 [Fimbriimonadales bacterium]